jgi:hypothetical protein
MKKKYLLSIATFNSYFFYIVGAEEHASFVLKIAQKQFDTKMSVDKYKEIKESIIYEHKKIAKSNYPNIANCSLNFDKFYCSSKSGNTLLVYSAYKNAHGAGYADIIRLKKEKMPLSKLRRDKYFQKFAFSFIITLKIWSKISALKIPKPLIDTILKYAYQYYYFDYDGPRTIVSHTLYLDFPQYDYSFLFVDDQKNFVINFKDEKKSNILYTKTKTKDGYLLRLIVPKKVHEGKHLRVNTEICKPGEIEIHGIEKGKEVFILKATKNDTLYTVDL